MRKFVNAIKKYIAAVLCFAIFFSFAGVVSFADENTESGVKTVRLGYFNFQNYLIGDGEGEYKTGYAYDLLCEIAVINKWEYEFVYGDFNDLYKELLAGNIDILPCLVYTPERAENHFFSDEEIYQELYYISTLTQNVNKDMTIKDLDGKRVSSVSDCYQNVVFEEWAKENDISVDLICTGSFEDSWKLLDEGKVDFILNIDNTEIDSGYTTLFEVGAGSSRFAISPYREDILSEMNSAVDLIYEIDPFKMSHLKEQYLTGSLSSFKLNDKEKEWLAQCDCIKIGGYSNDRPYTFYEKNGTTSGIYVDVASLLFERLGVTKPVEWILFDSEEEMYEALYSGEVDLLCPIYHGHYYAQSNNMIISEKIRDVNMGILYKGKLSENDIKKVAVTKSSVLSYYIKDNYPNVSVVTYGDVDECIKAIRAGEADAVVAHVSILNEMATKRIREYSVSSLVMGTPVCFAANNENNVLIGIVNRGLHLINERNLQSLDLKYDSSEEYALLTYFKNNKLLVISIFLAVVFLLMFSVLLVSNSRKMRKNLSEITRQKEIIEAGEEELIIARNAANAANKAKSRFLFNMSHDIRTPMNAILGYSDRLLKHMDEPKVVADSAGKIKGAGDYLLSLINDVLDMARIESDEIRIDETLNNIDERAKALCAVFEINMQNKDQNFIVDFSGVTDKYIWYDSLKLKQIMLNLISNAHKYTEIGGTITHTMEQLPSEKEGYAKYRIVVADNGIGMSKEYIEHVFDPFSRSDDSITKGTQGTGLGMAIVGNLVKLLGGTIDIDSEPGKGTKFTLEFDFRLATEEEIDKFENAKKPVAIYDNLKGCKVLLVDDNELNRDIAIEILEDEGIKVADIAQNGEIAVEKVANSKPGDYDLVFMDVQMPVMDGYEATRRIRKLENKEIANIPIIAMTANAFDEDRQNALEAGMNAHVTKPIDIEKIKECVNNIIISKNS